MKQTAEEILSKHTGCPIETIEKTEHYGKWVLKAMEEYASLSSPKVEGAYSERVPTDEQIKQKAWQWAETGKGSGDKYFADCNYANGLRDMRSELLPILESQARQIEALEHNIDLLKKEKSEAKEYWDIADEKIVSLEESVRVLKDGSDAVEFANWLACSPTLRYAPALKDGVWMSLEDSHEKTTEELYEEFLKPKQSNK